MKSLNVLGWPTYRYNSDSHPLYRWRSRLREHGIKVNFYFDHRNNKLRNCDYLLIHSRYFEKGFQNIYRRNSENEAELMDYLLEMKKYVGKLIWFDAADSTGSADFPIIHIVDSFVKKQVHKDLKLYTKPNKLRIWVDNDPTPHDNSFVPCNELHLNKIKLGWNIGLNDYRIFGYKMNRLSNYLSYSLYPNRYCHVDAERQLDLTFRGNLPREGNPVSWQRSEVIKLLGTLNRNIATGIPVEKKIYRKELRDSKISLSPFGWGEVCFRDFESFISGNLLIKPQMDHLRTFPNVYMENKTYIPIRWDLHDLKEKLEYALDNYTRLKQIAINGQETYKNAIADGEAFVKVIKDIVQ